MTWPGEGLLIKLWETLAERGVGGLLKPWQLKREARAQLESRRLEIVALADAEREADEIRSGRLKLGDSRYARALLAEAVIENEPEIQSTTEIRSAIEVAVSAIVSDAMRKEINVAKAITYAEEDLKNDHEAPPEKNIDQDWLNRWRDYAGNVSSDELQSLWGKLLAGEVKAPGLYSYRTLEFVKNLSMDEASKIERLARFVVFNVISRNQKTILDAEGMNFGALLELQDLGVISGVEAIGMGMTYKSTAPDSYLRTFPSNGRVLIVRHEDSTKEFKLDVYIVSVLGKQVMRLAQVSAHETYLRAVAAEFKSAGANVTIANYVDRSDGMIQVWNEEKV